MKMLFILFAILAMKVSTNLFRYLATKHYYIKFLSMKESTEICRYITPITRLFDKAGTQKTVVVCTNHVRYQTEISTQINNSLFFNEISKIFVTTLGTYSQRIRESFYPLYWINLPIVFLEINSFNIPKFFRIPIKILFWSVSVIAAYYLEKMLDTLPVVETLQEFLHMI